MTEIMQRKKKSIKIKKPVTRKNPYLFHLPIPEDYEFLYSEDLPYYEIKHSVNNDTYGNIRFKSKAKAIEYFKYVISDYTGTGKLQLIFWKTNYRGEILKEEALRR